ncbi:type II toxin-antitoxin system RelE/ParE family toxin [Burkholderia ubonensis]|uniref:type II toxin-antitoxin system RelE/ParE family toxin n=1 Tax=Burkholderia ubonensis TaxID=101571 RepID=UPI0009B4ADC6|nr:type II toxin-antitoxin system RelE/ParE family toxin [Burkholderia ubonensis]
MTWHVELIPEATAELLALPPGQRLVVLHVFVKKTQKTPHRAMETACARMKED